MSLNGNTDKAVSLLREAASLLAGDRESDDTAVSTAGRVVTGTETGDELCIQFESGPKPGASKFQVTVFWLLNN